MFEFHVIVLIFQKGRGLRLTNLCLMIKNEEFQDKEEVAFRRIFEEWTLRCTCYVEEVRQVVGEDDT